MSRDRSPEDDAFERFQPRERGRFGDNEMVGGNAGARSNLVDLKLYVRMDDPKKGSLAVVQNPDGPGPWKWLPRSQIEYVALAADLVEVTLPRWLAKREGLI